jgi:hypothetical protein
LDRGARFHDEKFEGYVDTVITQPLAQDPERLGLFMKLVRNQDDELNRGSSDLWQDLAIAGHRFQVATRQRLLCFNSIFIRLWKVAVIRKHRTGILAALDTRWVCRHNLALPLLMIWTSLFNNGPLLRISTSIWA